MIRDIEIQNFRCFEQTKIEGFERVNLIGGKNNSGKTALLEALLLSSFPYPLSILELKTIRQESDSVQTFPLEAWNTLFFAQDIHSIATIKGSSLVGETQLLEISTLALDSEGEHEKDKNFKRISTIASSKRSISPILNLAIHKDKNYFMVAYTDGVLALPENRLNNLPFIPSYLPKTVENIAKEYGKTLLKAKGKEVLNAIQIIDSSIQSIEQITIEKTNLYLTRANEQRLPLAIFGDAIKRVINIIISLVNNSYNILLIDEIENGIHYTNQREFWQMLFKLAVELDTQIFATTHSLEMIQAFEDVGLENYPEQGAYFELVRSPRTDKILGIKRNLRTLDYALKHEKEVRGE